MGLLCTLCLLYGTVIISLSMACSLTETFYCIFILVHSVYYMMIINLSMALSLPEAAAGALDLENEKLLFFLTLKFLSLS